MKYASYDHAGVITAFYDSKIHPSIPSNTIAISDEEWQECLLYQNLRRVDIATKKIITVTPPEPTLLELKQQAKAAVIKFTSDTRAQIADNADRYKLAGWTDKAQRALRVIKGNESATDLAILQVEADQRGNNEIATELARKQSEKAQALALTVAVIDGLESAALKAIARKRSANSLDSVLTELKQQTEIELTQLLNEKHS